MSSFNPLSFTNHTLHTHGLSLSQSLCSNGLPPIPDTCTWDAVTTCTPVTIFFPLGLRLCSERKKDYEKWHFRYHKLLHLAVFCMAFGHLYESCWSWRHSKRKAGRLNKLLAYLWSSYTASKYCIYCSSTPSLHRESIDSLIMHERKMCTLAQTCFGHMHTCIMHTGSHYCRCFVSPGTHVTASYKYLHL